MKKYPTPWQRKMMWASLTAIFVVVLFLIVGTVVYLSANLIAFLQPILIPVAIAAILAYLLDPVVTHLAARGFGRTKAVLTIFAIAFLAHRRALRLDRASHFRAKREPGPKITRFYRADARPRRRSDLSL